MGAISTASIGPLSYVHRGRDDGAPPSRAGDAPPPRVGDTPPPPVGDAPPSHGGGALPHGVDALPPRGGDDAPPSHGVHRCLGLAGASSPNLCYHRVHRLESQI